MTDLDFALAEARQHGRCFVGGPDLDCVVVPAASYAALTRAAALAEQRRRNRGRDMAAELARDAAALYGIELTRAEARFRLAQFAELLRGLLNRAGVDVDHYDDQSIVRDASILLPVYLARCDEDGVLGTFQLGGRYGDDEI